MNVLHVKKSYFFPFLFILVLLQFTGCASTNKKELIKKNEEIKTMKIDLQVKENAVTDLLDRLSWKDQEIGKLTDELRTAKTTIENLKSDIEKLKKTDLLDRLSIKDQEIGKLADELRSATATIGNLKNDIEKLRKTDLLDRLAAKDNEIGKLTDKLHTATSEIENLKTNIGKLSEVDVQMEDKKKEVDSRIKETIPLGSLEVTQGTNTPSTKGQKTE